MSHFILLGRRRLDWSTLSGRRGPRDDFPCWPSRLGFDGEPAASRGRVPSLGDDCRRLDSPRRPSRRARPFSAPDIPGLSTYSEPSDVDGVWLSSVLSLDDETDTRAVTLTEMAPASPPATTDDSWALDEDWLTSAFSPDGDAIEPVEPSSVNDDGERPSEEAGPVRTLDDSERRLESGSSAPWTASSRLRRRSGGRTGTGGPSPVARLRHSRSIRRIREPENPGQDRLRVIESRGVTWSCS